MEGFEDEDETGPPEGAEDGSNVVSIDFSRKK
jgi:hypothetical protein